MMMPMHCRMVVAMMLNGGAVAEWGRCQCQMVGAVPLSVWVGVVPLDVTCIAWRDRCATYTHIASRPKQCHSPARHGAFVILPSWGHADAVAAALAVPHPPRMLLQTQSMEHQLMVGNAGS